MLADGLYRVDYRGICAGFVVSQGTVSSCAPILRRKLAFWASIATRISD